MKGTGADDGADDGVLGVGEAGNGAYSRGMRREGGRDVLILTLRAGRARWTGVHHGRRTGWDSGDRHHSAQPALQNQYIPFKSHCHTHFKFTKRR